MNVLKNNMELMLEKLVCDMKDKGYTALFSFETINITEEDGRAHDRMGVVIRFKSEIFKQKPELIFFRDANYGYKYKLVCIKKFDDIRFDSILVKNIQLFPTLSEVFILNQKKEFYERGISKKKKFR